MVISEFFLFCLVSCVFALNTRGLITLSHNFKPTINNNTTGHRDKTWQEAFNNYKSKNIVAQKDIIYYIILMSY